MFNEIAPQDGPIGIVSQSGAMSVVPYALLRERGIGVRHSHATGNESDLTVADFALAVAHDPDVKLFHLAGRRAALTEHADWMRSATSVEEVKALARELVDVIGDPAVPGRYLIAVENVTQFADSDAERPLKELFQAVNRSDHFLVGDADVSNLSSGFGFVGDFKAGRRGVALKPDAYDGDSVFKTPFPKVKRSDFPEGRGFFVQNGRATLVQLPLS